ncbi:MAG: hypothetical protein ABJB03_07850 [Rhodoglobus sp.]
MMARKSHSLWTVIVVSALALGGCAAVPLPVPSETPSASPAAVQLDCGLVLPVELAASALGLPIGTLFDPAAGDKSAGQPNTGAVMTAMFETAVVAGGLVSCAYSAPDNGSGAQSDDGSRRLPNVTVRLLPNSAEEFALIEPDIDDGLSGLAPVAVGDTAFVACHPPEHDSCRVEMLVGTTWVEASVTPRPQDEAFLAFARALALAVQSAAPITPAASPKEVSCDTLLDPSDLSDAVGIANSESTDYGSFPSREAGIGTVADRRAGLIRCGWLSSDPGGPSNDVLATILPNSHAAWAAALPDKVNSSTDFAPVTGLGDEAYAGCGQDTCEVAILSGDIWIDLQNHAQPMGDLEGASSLAATVLANYLANR